MKTYKELVVAEQLLSIPKDFFSPDEVIKTKGGLLLRPQNFIPWDESLITLGHGIRWHIIAVAPIRTPKKVPCTDQFEDAVLFSKYLILEIDKPKPCREEHYERMYEGPND